MDELQGIQLLRKSVFDDKALQIDESLNGISKKLTELNGLIVPIENFPRLAGETDDTGRINRASLVVKNAGGGIVDFEAKTYVGAELLVRYGVFFRGLGKGTVFKLADAANKNLFILEENGTKFAGLLNLNIYGNKQNNLTGHGIFFDASSIPLDANELYPDSALLIQNITVQECPEDGIHITGRVREVELISVKSFRNVRDGVYLGGSDNVILSCVFYWNGRHGLRSRCGSARLSLIKCFGNRMHGFWFYYVDRFTANLLEAQENYYHGMLIEGARDFVITDLVVDANGYEATEDQPTGKNGVHIWNSSQFRIDFRATNFHIANSIPVIKAKQSYGLEIGMSSNYEINLISQFQQTADYFVHTHARTNAKLTVNNRVIIDTNEDETGIFSPTLISATSTYTVQQGYYTKVKNRVLFDVYLEINDVGTSSLSPAVSLPIMAASANRSNIVMVYVEGQNVEQEYIGVINANGVELRNKQFGYTSHSNFKTGTKIRINGSYRVN